MSYGVSHESEERRLKKLALQEQLRSLEEEEQAQYRHSQTSNFPSLNLPSTSSYHNDRSHPSSQYGMTSEPAYRAAGAQDSRASRLAPSYSQAGSAPWETASQPAASSSRDRYPATAASPTTLIRQYTPSGRPQPVPSESQVHDYLVAHMNQPDGLYAGWNIQGHRFDVYRLFTMVVQMGGSTQVTAKEAWRVIAAVLDFPYRSTSDVPRSSKAIGTELRTFFTKLLGGLEVLWERTKAVEETERSRQASSAYEPSPQRVHHPLPTRSPNLYQPPPTWPPQQQLTPPLTSRSPVTIAGPSSFRIDQRSSAHTSGSSTNARSTAYPPQTHPQAASSSSNGRTLWPSSSQPITQSSSQGANHLPSRSSTSAENKRQRQPKKVAQPKPSSSRAQNSSNATSDPQSSQRAKRTAPLSQIITTISPSVLHHPKKTSTQPAVPSQALPNAALQPSISARTTSSVTNGDSAKASTQSTWQKTEYNPPAVSSFDDLVASNILPCPPFGTSISLPPFPSAKLEYAWRAHELRSSIRKMSAGETRRHISPDEIFWWNKLVLLLQKNAGVVIPKPPVEAAPSSNTPPLPPPSMRPEQQLAKNAATNLVAGITAYANGSSAQPGSSSQATVVVDASQSSAAGSTVLPPKKRGRPKKTAEVGEVGEAAQPPAKKKRGRPPKIRPSMDGVNGIAALNGTGPAAAAHEATDAETSTPVADFLQMIYERQRGQPGASSNPPEVFPLVHHPDKNASRTEASTAQSIPTINDGGFGVPGAVAAAARRRWELHSGIGGSQAEGAGPSAVPRSMGTAKRGRGGFGMRGSASSSSAPRPAGPNSIPPPDSASPRKVLHLSGHKVSSAAINPRDALKPTQIHFPEPKPKKREPKSKSGSSAQPLSDGSQSARPSPLSTTSSKRRRFANLADSEEPSTIAEALLDLEPEVVFPDVFQLSQADLLGQTPFNQPLPEPSSPPESVVEYEEEMTDFDISDLPLPMDIRPVTSKKAKGKGKGIAIASSQPDTRTLGKKSSQTNLSASRTARSSLDPVDDTPRSTRSGLPLSQPASLRKANSRPRISSTLALPARRRAEAKVQMGRRSGPRIQLRPATRYISRTPASSVRSRSSGPTQNPTRSAPMTATKRVHRASSAVASKPVSKQEPRQRETEWSPSMVAISRPRTTAKSLRQPLPAQQVKVKRGQVDRVVVVIPIKPRRRRTLLRRGYYDAFRDDDSDDEPATSRSLAALRPLKLLPRGSIAKSARPRPPETIPLRFLSRPGIGLDDTFKYVLDERTFTKRLIETPCGWKGCDAVLASEDLLAKHVSFRKHTEQASFQAGTYGDTVLWRCHWDGCEGPCFEAETELKQHITARHIARTLACPFLDCELRSPNISHLTRHIAKTHDSPAEVPRPLADLSQHIPPMFNISDQPLPETARTDELTTPAVEGSIHISTFRQTTVIGKVVSLCFAGPDPIIHVEHPPHMLEVEETSSEEEQQEKWYDAREVDDLNKLAAIRGAKRKWEAVVHVPSRKLREDPISVTGTNDDEDIIRALEALLPGNQDPPRFTYPDSLYNLYPSQPIHDSPRPTEPVLGYPASVYHICHTTGVPSPLGAALGLDYLMDDIDPTLNGIDVDEDDPKQGDDQVEDEDAAEIADFFATHSPGAPTPWPAQFPDDDQDGYAEGENNLAGDKPALSEVADVLDEDPLLFPDM